MQRYLLRRILLLIPMIFAASVIIFLMLRLGTGDPALDYLRLSNLPPTPEMVASTRTMLGLDQPLVVQYGRWLWRALHLDFGVSFATQRPVLDDVLRFLPATLQLAGAALVLILLTSVPLGIWAARHREHLPDFIVRLIAFLGVSMPNFWLAFCWCCSSRSIYSGCRLWATAAGSISSCRPCRLRLCRWRLTPASCAPACWKSPDSAMSPGRACAA
jgi:nickel transport system permease protein